jgi:hypothetical protein
MSLGTFLYAADEVGRDDGVGFQAETMPGRRPEPTPEENKERNAQAMAMFMGGMAGVQGKKRR